ncbi:MAG: DMT family transporter [Deltaproteobacteria bacterium]|nr:DMT family transporter [Candidatus Zymogenaceae bacterium]
MSHEPMNARGAALAVLFCLLFGSNALPIKIALIWMPPIALAAVRFTISALVIYAYSRIVGINIVVQKGGWRHMCVVGAIFGAQFSLLYIGLNNTTVSHGAILMNLQPFYVAIFAHFFLTDDRLTPRKIIGILLAFVGVVFLFSRSETGGSQTLVGDAVMTVTAFLWASQTVYIKRHLEDWDPITVVLVPMIIGVYILVAAYLVLERGESVVVNPKVAAAIFYQAVIVAGFGYLTWTHLLLKYQASTLSTFVFLMPVSGVVLGVLCMNDELTVRLVTGLVCIAVGILVVNVKSREAFVVPE